jgi:long-chain acyl-CoA synthetase
MTRKGIPAFKKQAWCFGVAKMRKKTLNEYLLQHTRNHPDKVWLRERHGDEFTDLTWQQACDECFSVAAWLEHHLAGHKTNIGLLSRNRPHWFLADLATIVSGNVSVPLFTTLSEAHAEYILDFAEVKLLFLGETSNWESVRAVLPPSTEIVTLPGVDCDMPHRRWDDLVAECAGKPVHFAAEYDDLISIVFTSGTTGVPKGAMQTHRSMIAPVERTQLRVDLPAGTRAFSYLPLAHIAERQLVEMYSLVYASHVTFNESLQSLARDLREARPHYLFGAPRIWEQLQQNVITGFGGRSKFAAAMTADGENTARAIRQKLGLQDAKYLVTGAAPAAPALLEWFAALELPLTEGYGQTEAMGLIGASADEYQPGSIGKPIDGVELKIGDNDELLVRAEGLSPGYYKQPEKTAALWRDGWLHTGDKASVDEDGYVYLSGRVKDYFKTIHGKFVAPAPVESKFAACPYVAQLCLLGRGYSKTVMVCVLSAEGMAEENAVVDSALLDQLCKVNESLDHHARIGALIISADAWSIDNGLLTPTLKIRRDEVEDIFGSQAEALARQAAENHEALIARVNI